MEYNYHTHTVRCRHASGTEREYIENAIAAGMKELGFSDHVPYPFSDGYYSNFRMYVEQTEDYAAALSELREAYRGKIHIKIGYEAEYYPLFFENMLKLITKYECDYLILGQHFIENEITRKYSGITTQDEAYLRQYVDQTCEGMKTGVFTYFAHPDLVNYTGDDGIYEREYSRLIGCAIDCNVPLEINLLGVRDHRNYPHDKFFALCGRMGAPVCIGSDAHTADTVSDDASYAKALDMCARYNLKLIKNPTLRPVE